MSVNCKICGNGFSDPDSVVICNHKKGVVHLGCCMDNCSWNKTPCGHAVGTYDKI